MSHSRSIADLGLRVLHESESWQGDEPLHAAGTCLGSLSQRLINALIKRYNREIGLK
jgi:hypothetical protein